ncbi:MAG: hypothetical protein GKR89_00260 [Candidatus Latescibacteria bacterium]|nr:hypothetical protein [Candidatus Latescibacterota bacterium]
MFADIRRIDLWRGGAVGDFVLTLPALQTLVQAFPRARLRLIGSPRILSLAGNADILDHNSALLAPLFAPEGPLPDRTRALFAGTDLLLAYAVDPDGLLRRRLGQILGGRLLIHDPRPTAHQRQPVREHLLKPLHQWGLSAKDRLPRLSPSPAGHQYGQKIDLPQRTIVLHPGSGGPHKCWPWEHFAALAEALQIKGRSVVALRGPADSSAPLPCPVFDPPTLPQVTGLLQRAHFFVGNDSGPGHIAAALGRPTLTLFGPTDPLVWAPAGPRAHFLQAPNGDLNALGVEDVLRATLAALGTIP